MNRKWDLQSQRQVVDKCLQENISEAVTEVCTVSRKGIKEHMTLSTYKVGVLAQRTGG